MLNPFSLPHSPCGGLPTPVAHLRGGSQAAAQVCANEAAVSVVAGSAAVNGDGHVDRDSDEDAHGSHCVDSTFALNIGGLHVSLTASRTPQRVCASDADRLTSPHRRGSAVPVAGADGASTPALTSERIGVWCWSPRPALRLVTGALTRGVPHVSSMGQVAPVECIAVKGVAMPTGERRVTRAIDEAQDPHDETVEMIRFWDRARADGLVSASEMMEVRVRLHRILHQCQESIVAIEWADAGQRRAAGYLLHEMPAHVDRYERSILRRANELGMTLVPNNIIPFPQDNGEPIDAA